MDEKVEKLIYPLKYGDSYDMDLESEVSSQINVFQGVLFKFNDSDENDDYEPKCRVLPMPAHFGKQKWSILLAKNINWRN